MDTMDPLDVARRRRDRAELLAYLDSLVHERCGWPVEICPCRAWQRHPVPVAPKRRPGRPAGRAA